jgi:NADH:ubiquinone oxidoreductase subunit 6 (subunit J)
VLASIAGYYRRVTTEARPLNRLVAAVMVATLFAIVLQAMGEDAPRWVSVVSAVTAAAPIGLAATRTVPSAVRLGTRLDSVDTQRSLARSICRDHLFCLPSIATLLLVQVVWA